MRGFRNRGMRFRPRRRGFLQVRKPSVTSYVETSGNITLALSTTANYTVLLAADSPNKALVTDFNTSAAQCENNSRITKGSFIKFCLTAGTTPVNVNIWAYMNVRGTVTAPTTGFDFNLGPATEDNMVLRRQTLLYRRVVLTTSESREVTVRLGGKRNTFLGDASNLVFVVHNASTVSAMTFSAYGRIRVIPG